MSYVNVPMPMVNTKRRRKQRLFTKDIEQLLFSLGDPSYGLEPTVNALEEVLTEFLTDLCHNTSVYARAHGRNKVKMDDFPFALRNDPLKLARIEYIIKQSQRIEKAKKMYNLDDKSVATQAIGKPEKPSRKKRKKKTDVEEEDEDEESD
ncbi:transcription initiation factor TFIID subunit 13 [[Candida] anglica]|uniref:Transcription initiation factor TFIID subunit 13 n=1 Tax=[Candida] anglica TaxID=148631 RepID=A0ABP0EDL7_9ASCO